MAPILVGPVVLAIAAYAVYFQIRNPRQIVGYGTVTAKPRDFAAPA